MKCQVCICTLPLQAQSCDQQVKEEVRPFIVAQPQAYSSGYRQAYRTMEEMYSQLGLLG